jgi:hypothetical protein
MNIISVDGVKLIITPNDVFDIHRVYDETGEPITIIAITDECALLNGAPSTVKTHTQLIELLHGLILEYAETNQVASKPNAFLVALKKDFKAIIGVLRNVKFGK